MEAFGRFIGVVMVPIMLLNTFGGIFSGIWLAVLGEWWAVGAGIFAIFVTHFILGFAFLPAMLLMLPAAGFLEKNRLAMAMPFLALSQLYHVAIIVFWCVMVLLFFLERATASSFIPLLIWSYGVALGPLMFLASKESEGGAGEGALFMTFFTQVAFIVTMISLFLFPMSVLGVILLMSGILLIGATFQFALAIHVHNATQRERQWSPSSW